MENKIQNLCKFIELDLSQLSSDEVKLKYYVNILRSINVNVLKEILKTTFPKDIESETVCENLCKDFCVEYALLKEIPEFHQKTLKYIEYFKLILYV